MCVLGDYLAKNPVIITGSIAIVSWAVVHCLSKRRDFRNKKKEIRIQYLSDVWRQLVKAGTIKDDEALSEAFLNIQLLGTSEQIKLAKKIINEYLRTKVLNPQELADKIRNDLRSEIGLELTNEEVLYLNIVK